MLETESPIAVDRDTMQIIALTYRSRQQAGASESESHAAALRAYSELYPHHSPDECADVVGHIVASAGELAPEWVLRGLPLE